MDTRSIVIRAARQDDLPRLTEIHNRYVRHTAVTFDIEEWALGMAWFKQFAESGRYRLMVGEEHGRVIGYMGTTRFRLKAACDPTVETTIDCAPEAVGRGVGARLYDGELFDALADEDIHRLVAGYTLPNSASEALHKRFGFAPAGVFRENGRKFGKYWDVAWMERPLRLP